MIRAISCRNATPSATTRGSRRAGIRSSPSARRPAPARRGATVRRAGRRRRPLRARWSRRRSSRAVRASTASRTVAGTSLPPSASTSVTKNGFPAVARCSSAAVPAVRLGQRPHRAGGQRLDGEPPDRAAVQFAEQAAQRVAAVQFVRCGTSRSPAPAPTAIRRPSRLSTSSVASSAQCRSSSTMIVPAPGPGLPHDRRGQLVRLRRRPRPARRSRRRPPGRSPRTGASGRGVNSGSQAPHRTCRGGSQRSAEARSRAVFPPPASPSSRTSAPPWPPRSHVARVAQCREVPGRSSSGGVVWSAPMREQCQDTALPSIVLPTDRLVRADGFARAGPLARAGRWSAPARSPGLAGSACRTARPPGSGRR